MQTDDLNSMPTEDLWALYEAATAQLANKLAEEKARLHRREEKLRKLHLVPPKYQNPKNPAETWCGRGRHPRWLTALLRSGQGLDSLLIVSPQTEKHL
jgi:DNA-binding protein H-NS